MDIDDIISKKLVATATVVIVIAVLIGGFAFAGWGQAIASQFSLTGGGEGETGGVDTYTQGLTVNFKLNDPAAGALVTSDVSAQFFSSGANPFSATTSDTSITSGAYSSPVWQTTLDKGTYKMLISDSNTGSEIFYPSLSTVVVPGTNVTSLNGDTVVTLQPAVTQLVERASPSLSATVKAYNSTSHIYDIDTSTIDLTSNETYTSTKFDIKVSIDIAGIQGQKIESGRLYIAAISGLSYNTATINGQAVSLQSDIVGTADGVAGYYVTFNDLTAGQTVTFEFHAQKVGVGPADTTPVTVTLYEDLAVQNVDYRWWTDETTNIGVVV